MSLALRPGERVRVRSPSEILATLDENGTLEDLPFMPEMLAYCGGRYSVSRRADKTCDGAANMRRMRDVVHLDGLRCDGRAHGGCQAACLTYWNEAWLERLDAACPDTPERATGEHTAAERELAGTTTQSTDASDDEPVYRCQATQILEASTPLRWSDVTQYRTDVLNWGVRKVARGIFISAFNKIQVLSRRVLPRRARFHGGDRYPYFRGRLAGPPPKPDLMLQPGDLVRIKSKDEIAATVTDTDPPRLRGLTFDVEMLRYCGQTARVRARVNQIIDERTGKMIKIKSDCIMLDDVVCLADYHRFCSRATFVYWREAWLEKLDAV
jgi:hypothetical protein